MSDNLSIAANIAVLRSLMAFLLAREAVASGKSLSDLHQAFVSEFQSFSEDQQTYEQFEVSAVAALDGVFGLAETIRTSMLK